MECAGVAYLCAHALMFVYINFKQSGQGRLYMYLSNDLEEVRD